MTSKYVVNYWAEWSKMVEDARNNLSSNCPLIEDEVILFIDRYIERVKRGYP